MPWPNPETPHRSKSSEAKMRNPAAENPRDRCKCGNRGAVSCLTKSCKLCCHSRYCGKHGKMNHRIVPRRLNHRIERRQNPNPEKTYSLFGVVLCSLPTISGGLVFLSVVGLILGSVYVAFNALAPVFEEIWSFLEYLWEGFVSIVNFLVAVANFIGSVFEFIFEVILTSYYQSLDQ
jgi:hypothetical protein